MLTISTEKYESSLLNVELDIYKDEKGNFWFHGATLCDIFDLSNPSQIIQRHVDDDWRSKFPATHGKDAWYVMEPGLYQLLHASKHPTAKRFQRWVYGEVLPKLRASGGYIMPTATSSQLEVLQSEIHTLQSKLTNQVKYTSILNRLEDYGDLLTNSRLHVDIEDMVEFQDFVESRYGVSISPQATYYSREGEQYRHDKLKWFVTWLAEYHKEFNYPIPNELIELQAVVG